MVTFARRQPCHHGPCEGRNLQGIACVTEVDLSPKPCFNPTWAVTLFKGPKNVIMGYEISLTRILAGHESHYRLVETSNGQLGIQSLYSALSDYSGQQNPHEYH